MRYEIVFCKLSREHRKLKMLFILYIILYYYIYIRTRSNNSKTIWTRAQVLTEHMVQRPSISQVIIFRSCHSFPPHCQRSFKSFCHFHHILYRVPIKSCRFFFLSLRSPKLIQDRTSLVLRLMFLTLLWRWNLQSLSFHPSGSLLYLIWEIFLYFFPPFMS